MLLIIQLLADRLECLWVSLVIQKLRHDDVLFQRSISARTSSSTCTNLVISSSVGADWRWLASYQVLFLGGLGVDNRGGKGPRSWAWKEEGGTRTTYQYYNVPY